MDQETTYGVEIEFYTPYNESFQSLTQKLVDAGIKTQTELYNHNLI